MIWKLNISVCYYSLEELTYSNRGLINVTTPVFNVSMFFEPSSLFSSFQPERSSNVVGKQKGQGQTLETVLDRRKKEANKSRVSNHNRRTMADRKRNKGMIPSWPMWTSPAAGSRKLIAGAKDDEMDAEVRVSEGKEHIIVLDVVRWESHRTFQLLTDERLKSCSNLVSTT